MLNKQVLNINFGQGLETKVDDKQVSVGKFLVLENTIFDKQFLLQKRNGFGYLTDLDSTAMFLTTFHGNLTAIGDNLSAYSQGSDTWVDKGPIHPAELDTLTLIRSNTNQSQVDSAVSSNNLVCTVFTDDIPSMGSIVPTYKYVIADATTGQNIVAPTVIVPGSGTIEGPLRVFLLGRYFFIVYGVVITATHHLQALAINITNPSVKVADINISSQYLPTSSVGFDGVIANNSLYLAWNASDMGGAVRATRIDSTLSQSNTISFAAKVATFLTLAADLTTSVPVIYISFYDEASDDGYTAVVNSQLVTISAPAQIINNLTVYNLASTAQNGSAKVFYEKANAYSYDSSIATNIVYDISVSQAGVVGSPSVTQRGVGIASKAFLYEGISYFLSIYNSLYQPSYFLLNEDGEVVVKLAYQNGGVYYTMGLPSVTLTDSVAQIAYFYRGLIQSVNKTQGAQSVSGIYSQTGLNLAKFKFGTSKISTAEIGNSLHLSGGFIWMYDGFVPVELGFHLYPDYVEGTPSDEDGAMLAQDYFYSATYEWCDNQGNIHRSAPSIPIEVRVVAGTPITFDSVFTSGDTTITVDDATGLFVGQVIIDNDTAGNITAGTYITAIDGNDITLSLPVAGNSAVSPGDELQTTQTGSVTVNVPTLRLTYKTANPVKIVIYRSSTAQPTEYQVTSVIIPTLNDTTIDSIAFVDTNADSSIIGNNILYTTGGVLENIAAPATRILTLFNNRLWYIDSENPNSLGFSKQVIQNTPVEMSDLLTKYVAPTAATAGAPGTGPLRCLSALDDKLILFKSDAIYYLNGNGPDNTGANDQYSEPVFVTSVVGCENQQSIVFMPNGLMFESGKGIWLLDRGLNTSYIGAPVEGLTQGATVLSAVNVPDTNQIRFTLSSGVTLMYDYYYGQWGSFTNVPGISSTIYNGLHTYLDSRNKVFQETKGLYKDGANPVLIRFTTSWLNLAGIQGYERAYEFYLLGTYKSPHKLSARIAYDYNPSPSQVSMITPDNYTPPYGGEANWGAGAGWGGPGNLEQWRVFFKTQKTQAYQITVQEIYDPSYGVTAGEGLNISGISCVLGLKKGYKTIKFSNSVG